MSRESSPTWTSRPLLIAVGVALLLAVLVQPLSRQMAPMRWHKDSLANLFPAATAGWVYRDVPMAETAEMKRAVAEVLNYNEAIFRVFRSTRSDAEVSVYIAYWEPGRIHPRLIDQHTPDICWSGVGWTLVDSRYAETFPLPSGQRTKPGQYRRFSQAGSVQEVVYWHLVDGKASPFTGGPEDRREPDFLPELRRDFLRVYGAQYFVRIASNLSIERWEQEPLIGEIIQAVAGLGIGTNPSAGPSS